MTAVPTTNSSSGKPSNPKVLISIINLKPFFIAKKKESLEKFSNSLGLCDSFNHIVFIFIRKRYNQYIYLIEFRYNQSNNHRLRIF